MSKDTHLTIERSPHADSLLRNLPFLLLFSAQVVSLLGSGVTTVGLALFAYELTGGASAAVVVGNALMLRILAFLIFSQPAGVLADRVSRKAMLLGSDVGRFALVALFPFVTEVWQIYLLIFAINALTACFTPAYEATIPSIAGPARYTQALSLSRVAVDVEAVVGPMLAGLLIAFFDVRWVFWVDAASYLVSAALILGVSFPSIPAREVTKPTGFLSDIFHGTRLLLGEPSLRQAIVAGFAEAIAGAAAIVATVVYVQDVLKESEFMVAAVTAIVGVGSALAALFLGRIARYWERDAANPAELHVARHRWGARLLRIGGIVLALALLPGELKPPLWAFAVLWLGNGIGQALIAIPSSMLVAEHASETERGRAYAAHFALTHACWLVSYPAIGYAAAAWGTPRTFTCAGAVCLLTAFAVEWLGKGVDRQHVHFSSPSKC